MQPQNWIIIRGEIGFVRLLVPSGTTPEEFVDKLKKMSKLLKKSDLVPIESHFSVHKTFFGTVDEVISKIKELNCLFNLPGYCQNCSQKIS